MSTKVKLQEVRMKRGLSQEQVANLVGMTQSNYSRKENGSSKISSNEWERFSKILDVPLEDIYESEEGNLVIFKDNATGNYSGVNNIYSIPKHIEQLLESQNKYIAKLEEEIKNLKQS